MRNNGIKVENYGFYLASTKAMMNNDECAFEDLDHEVVMGRTLQQIYYIIHFSFCKIYR